MKKRIATLLVGAALLAAALPVWAADTAGTVTMEAEGDRAAVCLTLPDQADQSATALRLTFQVEGGDAKAEFLFDQGMNCPVQEYRYEESSGQLTVYLAGDKPLFQDGSAQLGTIRLKADKGAVAAVRVVEDSLELVNAAYGKTQTTSASGGEVTLTVAGTNPTPQPEQTPAPTAQTGGGQSQGQSQSTAAPGTATAQPTTAPQATPTKQNAAGNAAGSATPAPSETPAPEPTGTPLADPEETPQPTQAPQQDQPEQTETSGSSLFVVLGGAVILVVIIGAVILLKKR